MACDILYIIYTISKFQWCHTIDFRIQYLVANFTLESLTNSITYSGDNSCQIIFLHGCGGLLLPRD